MTEDQTPLIEPIEPEGRLPNETFGYMQPRWSQSWCVSASLQRVASAWRDLSC